jgi:hypothetical protein
MSAAKSNRKAAARKKRLAETIEALTALQFGSKQRNETAAYSVPVTLPDGSQVALSPGGQNPLIKAIIEHFCPAFAPGGVVLYIGDTENKFVHMAGPPPATGRPSNGSPASAPAGVRPGGQGLSLTERTARVDGRQESVIFIRSLSCSPFTNYSSAHCLHRLSNRRSGVSLRSIW